MELKYAEGGPAGQAITRRGDSPRPGALLPQVVHTAVTPDYFRAMGIALTRGRSFTEDDRADGVLVAVVNETAARRYWPGENPIGRQFAIGSLERFGSFRQPRPGEVEWREIVGVVADIRSGGFASEVQPEVFYNYKQIMGKSLRLTAAGVGLGLVIAYFVARWISSLFFGVSPADAVTLGVTCGLLIATAALATAHPTRRAVRVEPAVALRNE